MENPLFRASQRFLTFIWTCAASLFVSSTECEGRSPWMFGARSFEFVFNFVFVFLMGKTFLLRRTFPTQSPASAHRLLFKDLASAFSHPGGRAFHRHAFARQPLAGSQPPQWRIPKQLRSVESSTYNKSPVFLSVQRTGSSLPSLRTDRKL